MEREEQKPTHDYFKDVDLSTNDGRIKHIKGMDIEAGHLLYKWYKWHNKNALSTLGTYVKCMKYLMEQTTLDEAYRQKIENDIFQPWEANKYKLYE